MKKVCGAKLRGKAATCQKAPMANGRCRLHGDKTPSGPDSTHFKHGRYAAAFKGQMAEKFKQAQADGKPLDLLPELAIQRALLADYAESVTGKRTLTAATAKNLSDLVNDVVKTATTITKVRNDTAFTIAEFKFIQKGMTLLMEKYVPDPDKRRNFIAELGALIPEQHADQTDEPAELSTSTG